jgi:transposase-like protein
MSRRTRRNVTPQQKADLLRAHLKDKRSVVELCNEHQLQPSAFYGWQQHLFDHLETFFEPKKRAAPARDKALTERIAQLEARLAHKDEVIAEISEEYVRLKKKNGTP